MAVVRRFSFISKCSLSVCLQLALVLLAAGGALLPQMRAGISCGHDFDFHLVSWMDALASWRHLIPYPHWDVSANYGAGEPRFVFYPPLTWMLGALLGSLLPWSVVPLAMLWLLVGATGLAVRKLALEFLAEWAATLAGVAAIFSSYLLFTAYERSAMGELAGGALIPLLLLYALRSAKGHWADCNSLKLTVVFALCWLTNLPLGVMASYLLAASSLLVAVVSRSALPLKRAVVAVLLGLMLTAAYLLPAICQERWVAASQATDDPGLRIENSWIFGHHADPRLAEHDAELHKVSLVGGSMLAVLLSAALLSLCRRGCRQTVSAHKQLSPAAWWLMLLLPLLVLAMQLPLSLPLWNLLPKLRYLQFPWRLFLLLEAPMALLLMAAVWSFGRRLRVALVGLLLAGCGASLWVASHDYYQRCWPEDTVAGVLAVMHTGEGFEGFEEYAPPGADNSMIATGLPAGCLTDDPTVVLGQIDTEGANPDWWVEQKSCRVVAGWTRNEPELRGMELADGAGSVMILRLRRYPAWQIEVNGQPAQWAAEREDGLVALRLPHGPVKITARWHQTPDLWAGRALSFLALLLLLGWWGSLSRNKSVARPCNMRISRGKSASNL